MPELSIVIPARNERWLARTIQDVIEHIEADTEVIAVLDGAWAEPGIPQHERVQIIYLPESIGQRAATNLGVKISTATYVMKADGHMAFDQGFDRKVIEAAKELGPDVTQIPAQWNLHVYNYVCNACGRVDDQAPARTECLVCGSTDLRIEEVWEKRRRTTNWYLDSELKFSYGSDKQQTGDICDVMTSLGACFFMSRERYWQLGGLDTGHGSWGQLGCEVALKSWLSGGRHVVNRRTWFAHFFRVGGIGFPYPISGSDQDKARQYSRDLWFNNKWEGQVKPLRWLLEKFWPVPSWTEEQRDVLPDLRIDRGVSVTTRSPVGARSIADGSKGIVYYSDCRGDDRVLEASRRSIERSGLPIVAVTLKPITWSAATNIVLPLERGYLAMFKQILAGLESLDTDYVFFAEHDCIYDESHWSFVPPRHDCYFYNLSWWKVDAATGRAVTYVSKQTSQLCANRRLLLDHYRRRVARVERDGFTRAMGFEPGSHNRPERIDDVPSDVWRSVGPNLDIRHKHNLTPSRWSRDQFRSQRNCEGWQESYVNIAEVLGAVEAVA